MSKAQPEKVLLAHGGGGRLMEQLIEQRILPKFGTRSLRQQTDAAQLAVTSDTVCFTTDSFVVKPLFFNGGDIGKLAVCGTINDLAVTGARPLALSLSLILEEGLEMEVLERILDSAAQTAQVAGVPIVTGDTKVVEAGDVDGIFINTAGVGERLDNVDISFTHIKPGDQIVISGSIGDHGMTIMSRRKGITFDSPLKSDCAALNGLIFDVLNENGPDVRFMRDPTRGGLAATLNDIAAGSGCDVLVQEAVLPMHPTVRAAAEMLGFDLLNIANEGKVVFVVAPESAEAVQAACKAHPLGTKAAIIGEVIQAEDTEEPIVELMTKTGGRRIVQTPYGRELPRIC